MRIPFTLAALFALTFVASAQKLEPMADDPALSKFKPLKSPEYSKLYLKPGDKLAICGDSITEQKLYSRIIEDYLTMCVPELKVTVRQYGWSGERAPGFLARMTNDCLRFKPTIATTCYGMNDHEYRPYEERIGNTYRSNSVAIIEAFKANGARVVQGSPGCVGKMPGWVKTANGTVDDLNLNLCNLRNIDIEIAKQEGVRFADVFWPMMTSGTVARRKYGPEFCIAGKDGVHPGWAGQTVMAYAFLKALGVSGEIGTFTVDMGHGSIKATSGHEIVSGKNGTYEIRSHRYPFCPCETGGKNAANYPVCGADGIANDATIRAALSLVPFNQDLNRLMLIVKNGRAGVYRITWGGESKVFQGQELQKGVNLAAEFPSNPFSEAFTKVDTAVAAKQAYETKQIKERFHGKEARESKDVMETTVTETEKEREPLAAAIPAAMSPVTHTLKIEAL